MIHIINHICGKNRALSFEPPQNVGKTGDENPVSYFYCLKLTLNSESNLCRKESDGARGHVVSY